MTPTDVITIFEHLNLEGRANLTSTTRARGSPGGWLMPGTNWTKRKMPC
jgi:hypothetical protein